ncbi:MAG: hypothetical protein ACRD5H_17630 [Nitrososphaerales archaeon]
MALFLLSKVIAGVFTYDAGRKTLWLGRIESVEDKVCNDTMQISLNYFREGALTSYRFWINSDSTECIDRGNARNVLFSHSLLSDQKLCPIAEKWTRESIFHSRLL